MLHTDIWYYNRLNKHFDKRFEWYEDVAEFHVNPAPNKWIFDIHELGARITLTCQDDGRVIETREYI